MARNNKSITFRHVLFGMFWQTGQRDEPSDSCGGGNLSPQAKMEYFLQYYIRMERNLTLDFSNLRNIFTVSQGASEIIRYVVFGFFHIAVIGKGNVAERTFKIINPRLSIGQASGT